MKHLNKENTRQFLIYLVVGGLATIVEWVIFYLLNTLLKVHYAPATTVAFIFSTFANWVFGRMMLFRDTRGKKVWAELAQIYACALIGLGINLLIMWLGVDVLHMPDITVVITLTGEMITKMLATAVAFFWNFFIRKLIIYKI